MFQYVIILLARYTTPCVRHSNLLGHFAAAYELKPFYCPCLSLSPCSAYTYRTLLQYWHKQRRCSWSPFLLIIQARGIGGRAGVDQLQNPNPLLDNISLNKFFDPSNFSFAFPLRGKANWSWNPQIKKPRSLLYSNMGAANNFR